MKHPFALVAFTAILVLDPIATLADSPIVPEYDRVTVEVNIPGAVHVVLDDSQICEVPAGKRRINSVNEQFFACGFGIDDYCTSNSDIDHCTVYNVGGRTHKIAVSANGQTVTTKIQPAFQGGDRNSPLSWDYGFCFITSPDNKLTIDCGSATVDSSNDSVTSASSSNSGQSGSSASTTTSSSNNGQSGKTVTLECKMNGQVTGAVEDSPTIIELNEQESTLTVHFAPNHRIQPLKVISGDPWLRNDRSVLGPVHAVYGTDTISFSNASGSRYSINRNTGIFGIGEYASWYCTPQKRQF